MSHFNNPIPRTGLPKFSESSSQSSARESSSTGHLWKKAAKTTAQESVNGQALQQLQRRVEGLKRRIVGGVSTFKGWEWHDPPEYNIATAYDTDKVVIVSSDNGAVASNNANTGVFVCVQGTKSNDANTVPMELPDPATDANGAWLAEVYWVPIGGIGGNGGGGLSLHTIGTVNMNGNYLICTPISGGSNVNVAIQPELRNTIASQTIDGETWSYSYSGQTRVATYSNIVENQVITPRFLVGDIVPVSSCSNTGVSVSNVALTKISITGREWAKVPAVYSP